MKELPLVTVIIPTYNRSHLIENSIKSVLNQTYKNLELYIIDDASTDKTEEIISSIKDDRIIYIKNSTNFGAAKSRNIAIERANGKYVAFLDSDDTWYRNKLELQVNEMENTSENVAFCYCGMELIDYETKEITKKVNDDVDIDYNFKNGSYFLTPANVTQFIRTNTLKKLGGFNTNLRGHQDTDLIIRILKNSYSYKYIKQILVSVTRNHDQMMTNSENYIKAREVFLENHSDYLGKKILFNLAKQISNYYLMNEDRKKANYYLIKAITINPFHIKSIIMLILFNISKSIFEKIYLQKYSNGIPNTSGLKNN